MDAYIKLSHVVEEVIYLVSQFSTFALSGSDAHLTPDFAPNRV